MKTKKLSDKTLASKINARIRWDKRVSPMDILITINDGRVTLNGYFDKEFRREAALEIIQTTAGVVDLIDESQILPDYWRTDADLERLLDAQLFAIDYHQGEWMNVHVADGVVKFEGRVFRSSLKAYASGIAWELSGVRDCLNLIEVSNPPDLASDKQSISASLHSEILC